MNSYQQNDPVVLTETFSIDDGTGTLVPTDPTTVSLLVVSPDGTDQTYAYEVAAVTRLDTGVYTKTITADQVGVWSYVWTGTGSAAGVSQGQFTVTDIITRHGIDLCSIGRVKDWLGQTDDANDSQIAQLVTAASAAVMGFCQREFAPVSTSTTRTFALLANGLIRFGGYDLQSATSVQIDTDTASTPTTIPDTQYQLHPVSAPNGVYSYLQFYTFAIGPILRQAYGLPRQVAVTGTWGWPSIPADVEQACIITVAKWFKRDQVSWSNELPVPQMGPGDGLALPYDARVLLAPYRRPL